MKTFDEIAEEAAQTVIDAHNVQRFTDEPGEEPTETAIRTLGGELGDGEITYEQGLAEIVKAAVEIDRTQRPGVDREQVGGPWPCCKHCADDQPHIEANTHELLCQSCTRDEVIARSEATKINRDANELETWAENIRESLATDKSNDWSEELAALDQITGETS